MQDSKPYEEGFFMGMDAKEVDQYNAGFAIDANPYKTGSADWIQWNAGWKAAY